MGKYEIGNIFFRRYKTAMWAKFDPNIYTVYKKDIIAGAIHYWLKTNTETIILPICEHDLDAFYITCAEKVLYGK